MRLAVLASIALLCACQREPARSAQRLPQDSAPGGPIQPGPVIVGVLEQPQCDSDTALAVRALFQKVGPDWVALDRPSARDPVRGSRFEWVVAFRGREVARLVAVDTGWRFNRWGQPTEHLQQLVPGQRVPRKANQEGCAFAGTCSTPQLRPLVVVSQPNFRDPQRWGLYQPADSDRQLLFPRFEAEVDSVTVCQKGTKDLEVWHYSTADLLLGRSFQDGFGHRLVTVFLDQHDYDCIYPYGYEWATHWFFMGPDTVRFVGRDITLVDVGDYDGDGQSEVLFWHSGEQDFGYKLSYAGFRKHADYFWSGP